jgi:hypothetical protein
MIFFDEVREIEEGGYIILIKRKKLFVPDDPENSDYKKIQKWIGEGNIPLSAVSISPLTPRQVIDKEILHKIPYKVLILALADYLGKTKAQVVNKLKSKL